MGARLIAYECVAPDHTSNLEHPDKLTVHDGQWAFCCFDAFADGHEWKSTGGLDLAELMRHAGLAIGPKTARTVASEVKTSSAR